MNLWPDNYTCAISLTFDDGLDSQLARAIPALDAHDLRGTFYLNPVGSADPESPKSWQKSLQRWSAAARQGHEMGNHTLTHPCSLNIQADWIKDNLINMTLAEMEINLDEAQHRLQTVFPHQTVTSFAYPCYESDVGRGVERQSYVPLVARRFVAGRARGELANDPLFCDLHHLSSWNVERQSGASLIGLVEQTAAEGRWGILTFHGIQEQHLSVSYDDFVALLDHLARRRTAVWVAPVAEVAQWVRGLQ